MQDVKQWYQSTDLIIEKSKTDGVGKLVCKMVSEEDAKLIVAAPDLYDAVKMLIKAIGDIPVCNLPSAIALASGFAIEAAKKAEGK